MTSRRNAWRNAACMLLIAAALLLRALLPGGYMLEQGRAGDLVVSVCNSDAMLVIPMKPDAPASDEDGSKGDTCAFASLADSATPPDPMARPSVPQVAEAAYDATRARALSPASRNDLPPARGPPLTV